MIRTTDSTQLAVLARHFENATPFRHVMVDDFFEPAICQRLLDEFPSFEERYAINEMGEVGRKAVRMNVRDVSDTYRDLDRYLGTREFLDRVSKITGIQDLLYDPDYIGGGTHENQDGQGLDAHVDFNYHPRTKTHRRLNLIVYLNHEWEEAWGGALQLHSDPWNPSVNQTRSILPLFNRAVIFETNEVSWHGFTRIELPEGKKSLSRKSFAIYLYTKSRPAAETAASHGTIYVPDALPDGLTAGKVLDSTDISELQSRFTRLRTQLRYLYDREKQFGAQIAALDRAVAEARAAQRVPIQGYGTQIGAHAGMWGDGWVGTQLRLTIEPARACKGLLLDLWAPDQLASEQMLEIDIGGSRWEYRVARGARSSAKLEIRLPAKRPAELRIHALQSFVPASSGTSGDDRELAWRLLVVELLH